MDKTDYNYRHKYAVKMCYQEGVVSCEVCNSRTDGNEMHQSGYLGRTNFANRPINAQNDDDAIHPRVFAR